MTESEIRDRIVERLSIQKESQDTVFFREMFISNFARRADLVAVNAKLAAFEIKSARDSLERLPGQLSVYANHFEQVTVVVATKHLLQVMGRLPRRVGLWEATASGDLNEHRSARSRRVIKSNLLTFLPVDELRQLLRRHDQCSTGDRGSLICHANKLDHETIRIYVLEFMRRRTARLESKRKTNPLQVHGQERVTQSMESNLQRFLLQAQTTGSTTATPRRLS
ncbi:hypothetical protein AWB80_01491 [Caballeronia pedi]|uniref:Sce7726 family protein n=1 Tax=Caballeronia pedi TaxID=1777141 RepID=A0A157ZYZ3_9BURK|nr:sce7726 family protein [Caballeronia pedi]SAK50656.1 hypothetical protein AWB80_01491 [Caballeronia pedi]